MNENTYARARDEVRRLRTAYLRGVRHASGDMPVHKAKVLMDAAVENAAWLYSMPKVTRPRIVTAGGARYKVEHGRMYRQLGCYAQWAPMRGIDAEKMLELAGLFDHPTETVPE